MEPLSLSYFSDWHRACRAVATVYATSKNSINWRLPRKKVVLRESKVIKGLP